MRTLLSPPLTSATPHDGRLPAVFLDNHDEAAFTEIMQRHGPMHCGMARRQTRNSADAEDLCQAAFLLLARKSSGSSICRPLPVGSSACTVVWLRIGGRCKPVEHDMNI